jgi:hypothetical protein
MDNTPNVLSRSACTVATTLALTSYGYVTIHCNKQFFVLTWISVVKMARDSQKQRNGRHDVFDTRCRFYKIPSNQTSNSLWGSNIPINRTILLSFFLPLFSLSFCLYVYLDSHYTCFCTYLWLDSLMPCFILNCSLIQCSGEFLIQYILKVPTMPSTTSDYILFFLYRRKRALKVSHG